MLAYLYNVAGAFFLFFSSGDKQIVTFKVPKAPVCEFYSVFPNRCWAFIS